MGKGRLKESFIAGTIFLVPLLAIYIIVRTAINGVLGVWEEIFIRFFLGQYYSPLFAFFLTAVLIYGIGFFVTSPFCNRTAGEFLAKIPIVNKPWNVVRSITKRVRMIAGGEYRQVIYEQFGRGTNRWKPAFIIGKTVFHNANGQERLMLVIAGSVLSLPDALWIPPEDTKIVRGGIKNTGLFILSGGFVNPEQLELEEWTKEKYSQIPEISP